MNRLQHVVSYTQPCGQLSLEGGRGGEGRGEGRGRGESGREEGREEGREGGREGGRVRGKGGERKERVFNQLDTYTLMWCMYTLQIL